MPYCQEHLWEQVSELNRKCQDYECPTYLLDSKLKRKSSVRRNLFPSECQSIFIKTKLAIYKGLKKINTIFRPTSITFLVGTFQNPLCKDSFKRSQREDPDFFPCDFQTPSRKVKKVLGRTPIKLYSPFSIETPGSFL